MNIKIESGANVQITDKPIVNVYGDVVQHKEVHIHPEDKRRDSPRAKNPASIKQPKDKPRETMTFKRKSDVLDGHLILLFSRLSNAGWIEGNEADFKALFSGKNDEDCRLTWKGSYGKGTLVELFKQMTATSLIYLPDGFTLSAILEGHFADAEGKWLTGLDKGNKANAKALPFIQECVDLLKINPKGGYQDDEDFQIKYDPYDHQDLKYHKS